MKKLIAVLFCSVFVLALAGSVYAADLRIGGDAYVEGVWTDNYGSALGVGTFDNGYRSDQRYWAQRVVLKLDAVLENGIELRTAYNVSGGFNGPSAWGVGSKATNIYADNSGTGAAAAHPAAFQTEYAYLHVPIGGFTVDAGHMLKSWGDGFDDFETPCDRFKVGYKVNDMLTLGAYVRKDTETFSVDSGKGDADTYEVEAVATPNSSTKTGINLSFSQNQQDRSGEQRGRYHFADKWHTDAFFNTKLGVVTIMSEAAYNSTNGSYPGYNSMDDKKGVGRGYGQFGGFALAQAEVVPAVTMTGAVAFASNGYSADDDFQPTLLFGTRNNPVALLNFQSLGSTATTWAALAAADFKANDCTTIHGLVAYASLGDGTGDVRANHEGNVMPDAGRALGLVELDATVKYQISKSTAWTVGATMGIPTSVPNQTVFNDDGKATRDNIYGAFQKLSVSF